MSDPPTDSPDPAQRPITATVKVTGDRAALLRDLSAVLGRSPETLALEWAAGSLELPDGPIGDRVPAESWGLFDGPEDLSRSCTRDWQARKREVDESLAERERGKVYPDGDSFLPALADDAGIDLEEIKRRADV